jgi:hypothetical protein
LDAQLQIAWVGTEFFPIPTFRTDENKEAIIRSVTLFGEVDFYD